jgi:hypothetical protein
VQDALTGATDKLTTTREVNGQKFYDYEVLGPVRHPSVPCHHPPVPGVTLPSSGGSLPSPGVTSLSPGVTSTLPALPTCYAVFKQDLGMLSDRRREGEGAWKSSARGMGPE